MKSLAPKARVSSHETSAASSQLEAALEVFAAVQPLAMGDEHKAS